MYTTKEKTRAVELYIKYGRKAAAAIRELGYPSRAQLATWYKEWEANGGSLPDHSMERYSAEQKRAAVEHYLSHGKCNAFTRRELGYPGCWKLLADWVDEFAPGERRTTRPKTFAIEQKQDAVEALETRDRTAGEVARAVGSSRCSLYKWRRELIGGRGGAMDDGTKAEDLSIEALEARRSELEAEVRSLELRRDIMQGAIDLLGKGAGAAPENELTNREKTLLVDSLRPKWALRDLLESLSMPKSSYYYQRGSASGDRDAGARELVRAVFDANDGKYGRRRVSDELKAAGHVIGERRAARIMREEGLVARGVPRRRRGYSSYAGEVSEHPGNRVGHDFSAGLPNLLWLTDVTQFSIPAGRLYLSPVLDCFDGAIASWTVSTSPNAEMANSMLRAALETTTREERERLVIHSDCGCHYRWPEWISICEEAGITRSMSRKGCSPDNSRMEGFFGTLKNEMFYGRDWSKATLEELEAKINAHIVWHNERRRKRSLGGMSPLQYRRSLGLAA